MFHSGKFRIVIRAFTCRRDIAHSALLARLLERMGCETLLASVRNFATAARHWRPHAIVVNTPSKIPVCRELAPEACVVFLDGEGGEPIGTSNATYFAQHPETFDQAHLVLIWGPETRRFFEQLMPRSDLSKVHVVGNPKLDLVRYLPREARAPADTSSIGVVGRFSQLNHHAGVPTLRSLLSGGVDEVVSAARCFHSLCTAIEAILERTDLGISIRPYPTEALETYRELVIPRFGDRVHVDDSLSFPAWAARQRALLTPASTSFLEAYLLGVPVVGLDRMAGTAELARARYPLAAELQRTVHAPANLEELCELVSSPIPPAGRSRIVDDQLAAFHQWPSSRGASFEAAMSIMALLNRSRFRSRAHWPKALLGLRDEITFRRACRANRLHPNMNYKEGYHALPAYLDEMAEAAMADAPMADATRARATA